MTVKLDETSQRLIEQLEGLYSGDMEGMKTLATLKRSPAIIRQYQVLRENPIVIKIRDEILPKVKEAHEALTNSQAHKLPDMDRAMHLATISWGEWFLMALGDDPEKQIYSIQNHIAKLAERAGVISKG